MSIQITNDLALKIGQVLSNEINRAIVKFSDNTTYEVYLVATEIYDNTIEKKIIVNMTFSVYLEEEKTVVEIEYYKDDQLQLKRTDLQIELTLGVNSISHQIAISYQSQ
jgi:hypothetical protein